MDVNEGNKNNFQSKNNYKKEKTMNNIDNKKENKFNTFTSLNIFNNNYFNNLIPRYHSTDSISKKNIVINSTTNNHITIINNIIKTPKKKETSSTQSRKSNLKKLNFHSGNKNVKFSKDVLNTSSSIIYDLDIKKIGEKKVPNPKRNKSLFLNEKFAKINLEYFKEINKRRSADFIDKEVYNEELNNLNQACSNDNSKSNSNNNITISNFNEINIIEQDNIKEMKIKNELKELFKEKGEICMHIKNFGIFKGFSAISFINGEKLNEDKIGISLNLPLSYHHHKYISNFFAIYDGHNGEKISKYLKENFHNILYKNEKLYSQTDEVLYNTFEKVENNLMNENNENCGSSALILLNIDKNIFVANLGDSRAIISIDNCYEVSQLSKEHILSNKSEKDRIESFKGKIKEIEENKIKVQKIFPGNLTVTRSIGDFQSKLKIYNGIPNMISSVPDIIKIYNNENIDFIFLTSNGLIEYMNNYEICNIIYKTLKEGILSDISFEKTIEKINTNIINTAIEKGCKKNLSFIFLAMNNLYKNFKENQIHNVNEALARLKILINEPDIIYKNAYIKIRDITHTSNYPFCTYINKFFSPPLHSPDPNIFAKSIDENDNIPDISEKMIKDNDDNNKKNIKIKKNKEKKKKSLWSFLCFLNCGLD